MFVYLHGLICLLILSGDILPITLLFYNHQYILFGYQLLQQLLWFSFRTERDNLRFDEQKTTEMEGEISRLQHELSQVSWELEEVQRQGNATAQEELEALQIKYKRLQDMVEPFQVTV